MVFDVIDTETYDRGDLILDATGKYLKMACRVREDGAKKTYLGSPENIRGRVWDDIIKKGRIEHNRGRKYTVYFHNAKYDFYNLANLNDKGIVILCENPFIAGYYEDVIATKSTKEFKSWQRWAEMNHVKYRIIKDEGGLITYERKKEIVKFNDSISIFRMSLKKLGDIIGLEKLETPEYSHKRQLSKKDLDEIKVYCLRDCEIGVKAIKMIKKKMRDEGVEVRNLCTINQVAIGYLMNSLRKNEHWRYCIKPNYYGKPSEWLIHSKYATDIHEAYRGGYVRVWDIGKFKNVTSIDFNNLYPYSGMDMRFPDLRTERKIENPSSKYLGHIGLSRAMVYNENDDLGFLPVRLPNGSHIFKKGTYAIGTWTNEELTFAKQNGYRILKIEWSIVYDDAPNPFKEIFSRLYELRTQSGSEFDSMFYKDMMNRGIGKFAQRKVQREYVIDSIEMIDKYLEKNYAVVKGIPGSTSMVYEKELDEYPKKYYNPIIPTLINAHARILMYSNYKKIPKELLLYSDTDSIIWKDIPELVGEFYIGSEIGKFKVDKDYETGEELTGVPGTIYGSKTKAIGNNIAISGMHKAGITLEDFKKGVVKGKKMRGLKTIGGRVGEFYEEQRDLFEQTREFLESRKKLEDQKLFIDYTLENVDTFMEEISSIGV